MSISETQCKDTGRRNGTNFFDQGDANAGLSAVLEVLGQAETMADINNYILRAREEGRLA